MDFDQVVDRRNTFSNKWDDMKAVYGISPDTGIAMWVADMDFRSPRCVQTVLSKAVDHGIFGYMSNSTGYLEAICWWMHSRHGWAIRPEWIQTTNGLCNAIALILDTFTQPGDHVILFNPVYHAFEKTIRSADRQITQCPLVRVGDTYRMDCDNYDQFLTGKEKAAILCSPHNPSGRVWHPEELRSVARFCERNDLLLISDEIHQDLVYSGNKHTPLPVAAPDAIDRIIVLSSASKTFNIAGLHTGQVIIPDETLRARFNNRVAALAIGSNSVSVRATTAAYSPNGAKWVDELVSYLDVNKAMFESGVNSIPGVQAMPAQSTYLCWIDFAGTGLSIKEVEDRVFRKAEIAANAGRTFGPGGENFMRFNVGMPRSQVNEAIERLNFALRS
ncbi:MalY/PatB family protein [uncultured Ruegeria sp.]|uniref:MalY/PatB family protein n=1 Tax=uncultured Ruegeria sp. TaxID=259304 RepID=UPI002618AD49|nr:MalY/PatB family protein [uncultured Ruegeria sp.]